MGNQQLSKSCKKCGANFEGKTSTVYCTACNNLRVRKNVAKSITQRPSKEHFLIYEVNVRRDKKLIRVGKTTTLEEAIIMRDEFIKTNPADWSKPHLIKHNISFFHKMRPLILEDRKCCNRCNKYLIGLNKSLWVVHHIDHNRENNSLSNFELLCKSCHQREHCKRDELGRFKSSETISKESTLK